MKKALVCFFLLFPSFAFSAEIPTYCHVENQHGYCVWSSLETLGNYYNIVLLKGLVQKKCDEEAPDGASLKDVKNFSSKAKLRIITKDNARAKFLIANCPCVIGVSNYPDIDDEHAIVLTYIDNNVVKFVDTNIPGKVQVKDRAWLAKHWHGWTIVLPKGKKMIAPFGVR